MLEDRPGSIKEVADVFRAYHIRVMSLLSTFEKAPHGSPATFMSGSSTSIAKDWRALKKDL